MTPPHAPSTQDELAENEGLNALLGAASREPLLGGQQNNLYLQFMTNCWRRQFPGGIVTLLHPDGFLSDPKAADLRREAYQRYRRHFHFINELMLFKEISDTREYGVHVYGSTQKSPEFLQVCVSIPSVCRGPKPRSRREWRATGPQASRRRLGSSTTRRATRTGG